MRKYLFIILVAFIALSCEDSAQDQSQNPESVQQEQVDYQGLNQKTDVVDANKQDKSEESNVSLVELLMIGLSLILSIISLVLALQSLRASKYTSDDKIDNLAKDVSNLRVRMNDAERLLANIKSSQRSSSNIASSSPSQTRQSVYTPSPVSPQKQDVQGDNKTTEQSNDKKEIISPQQQKKEKKGDDSKKHSSKVLYLEINSDDCFFNVSEQKTEASKFIAHVIPGDRAATFELIDVERIRSVNTSKSIKQKGTVPIKDASGIKQQEPGSMHKVTDDGNGSYWVIDKPVIVEFVK